MYCHRQHCGTSHHDLTVNKQRQYTVDIPNKQQNRQELVDYILKKDNHMLVETEGQVGRVWLVDPFK